MAETVTSSVSALLLQPLKLKAASENDWFRESKDSPCRSRKYFLCHYCRADTLNLGLKMLQYACQASGGDRDWLSGTERQSFFFFFFLQGQTAKTHPQGGPTHNPIRSRERGRNPIWVLARSESCIHSRYGNEKCMRWFMRLFFQRVQKTSTVRRVLLSKTGSTFDASKVEEKLLWTAVTL